MKIMLGYEYKTYNHIILVEWINSNNRFLGGSALRCSSLMPLSKAGKDCKISSPLGVIQNKPT